MSFHLFKGLSHLLKTVTPFLPDVHQHHATALIDHLEKAAAAVAKDE